MTVQILQGDCLEVLKTLPDESVQCGVTSPPYYGLRDYGSEPSIWYGDQDCDHDWQEYIKPAANGIIHDGGMTGETLSGNSGTRKAQHSDFCNRCGAWRGSLGLEPSPELFVEHLVIIFHEFRRVLKPDGTFWLNLGDSYAGSGGVGNQRDDANKGNMPHFKNPNSMEITRSKRNSKHWGGGNLPATGDLKPKDMIGIPWMVAFALRSDGWYLRSDIIWNKPNPMPESVTDRPTKSHEHIFLLSKSAHYYYDSEAIKEEGSPETPRSNLLGVSDHHKNVDGAPGQTPHSMNKPRSHAENSFARKVKEEPGPGQPNQHREDREDVVYSGTRNKRDVWTVTTKPYRGAHFATFPPDLIEPCILAGTSERGECPKCGKAWKRVVEKTAVNRNDLPQDDPRYRPNRYQDTKQSELRGEFESGKYSETKTLGWEPGCDCGLEPVPQTVLDPFNGSGTTGETSIRYNRNYIGIELNQKYIELTNQRLSEIQPVLALL